MARIKSELHEDIEIVMEQPPGSCTPKQFAKKHDVVRQIVDRRAREGRIRNEKGEIAVAAQALDKRYRIWILEGADIWEQERRGPKPKDEK